MLSAFMIGWGGNAAFAGNLPARDAPDFIARPTLDRAGFTAWLEGVRHQAIKEGIKPATVERAFTDIALIGRVIELDRRQAEFHLTFDAYLNNVVNRRRYDKGRHLMARHRQLLDDIQDRFGVNAHIILALWGIETDFGRVGGSFPVISSLATLAYEGRRRTLFTNQLLAALHIIDQGHIRSDQMKGSWAGAMGQVQFMPSTFRHYAHDYDRDGKKDIWNNRADALASAANYLAKSGWNKDIGWGYAVVLPEDFTPKSGKHKNRLDFHSPDHWHRLGIRPLQPDDQPGGQSNSQPGGQLDDQPGGNNDIADSPVALVIPENGSKRAFLVSRNFDVLMRWNRSFYFGLAVGILADQIGQKSP